MKTGLLIFQLQSQKQKCLSLRYRGVSIVEGVMMAVRTIAHGNLISEYIYGFKDLLLVAERAVC